MKVAKIKFMAVSVFTIGVLLLTGCGNDDKTNSEKMMEEDMGMDEEDM